MFRKTILAAAALILAAGCTSNSDNIPDGGSVNPPPPPPGGDAGINPPLEDGGMQMVQEFPSSSKAVVRFKRTERLRNDFATALGLTNATLCRELGQYSCTDMVHTIALGGVEPYSLGIREGLEHTTITTPLAVERVALAGCEQLVTNDFTDDTRALVFKVTELGVDANGAIPDLEAAGVKNAIDEMYKRAVQRPARETEIEHLKQLYRDIEATNEPGPARDWAILACFSVMTTMEALFY